MVFPPQRALADFCKSLPVLPHCCFPSPWLELPGPPPAVPQKLSALTETVLALPAGISWGYRKAAPRAEL